MSIVSTYNPSNFFSEYPSGGKISSKFLPPKKNPSGILFPEATFYRGVGKKRNELTFSRTKNKRISTTPTFLFSFSLYWTPIILLSNLGFFPFRFSLYVFFLSQKNLWEKKKKKVSSWTTVFSICNHRSFPNPKFNRDELYKTSNTFSMQKKIRNFGSSFSLGKIEKINYIKSRRFRQKNLRGSNILQSPRLLKSPGDKRKFDSVKKGESPIIDRKSGIGEKKENKSFLLEMGMTPVQDKKVPRDGILYGMSDKDTAIDSRFTTSALLKFLEILDGFYTFSSSKLSGSIIIAKLLEKTILIDSFLNNKEHIISEFQSMKEIFPKKPILFP